MGLGVNIALMQNIGKLDNLAVNILLPIGYIVLQIPKVDFAFNDQLSHVGWYFGRIQVSLNNRFNC